MLSFYYRPDLSAGSFRASALVDALLKIVPPDCTIDVITTAPNRYSTFTQEASEVESAASLNVRRIALPAHRNDIVGQSRAFSHFARVANRYAANTRYDVVFATSSRLMTAVLGAWIARRTRSRLYLDIRDIFVDTIGDIFPNVAGAFKIPFSALERWAVRRADRVNLVSRGFEGYFLARYPGRNYTWFTNGIDEEFLTADWSRTSASQVGEDPLVVVYAGNIGEGQGLHEILPTLALQLGRRVHFRVIGDGGRRELLLDRLRKSHVDNVEVLSPKLRSELLKEYANADILFLHLNAHEAFKKVLPSKIFEYAATGKPIWAGVAGYAASFIAAEVPNAAVFAPCDVSQAIERLNDMALCHQPRREFVERYARKNIAHAMATDIVRLAQLETR